jgi:hypothetical protein
MDLKDIAGKIADVAPVLGTVFGGPVGAATGLAVKAIISAFGLKGDATPDEIDNAIKTDPQAAIKLRIAEMDYNLALNKQKLDEQEMYLKDVQNARQMNIEGVKATGKRDVEDKVFDWVIIAGFAAVLIVFIYAKPAESTNLGLMVGALTSAFITIVAFRRGSSRSSDEKTKLLAKAEAIK